MGNKKKKVQDMLDRIQDVSKDEAKKEAKLINLKSLLIGLLVAIVIGAIGYKVIQGMPKDQAVADNVKIEKQADVKTVDTYSVIDLPEWAKKPWDTLTETDVENMVKDQEDNFIGWVANALPSEKDGFTTDTSKEYDQDGLPNEYYTTNTKEAFEKNMAIIVNRIINPLFGNWVDFQRPTGIPNAQIVGTIYSDLGDTGYLQSIINKKGQSVIFYDENQDLYGGTVEKPQGKQLNRFIGILKSGDITFGEKEDKLKLELDVDYMLSANQVYKSKHITVDLSGDGHGNYRIVGGTINDK